MATTIWKFAFPIDDEVRIKMPKGAVIRHVALQGGTPCIWAEVDPYAETEIRRFAILGTGHPMPVYTAFVATFQIPPFVWHLYEMVNL